MSSLWNKDDIRRRERNLDIAFYAVLLFVVFAIAMFLGYVLMFAGIKGATLATGTIALCIVYMGLQYRINRETYVCRGSDITAQHERVFRTDRLVAGCVLVYGIFVGVIGLVVK